MPPPPPPSFDYYAELEVSKSATLQEITTAYRRLARVHHPDKNPGEQAAATAKFQKVQHAYETLSSTAGRKRYDTFPTARGHCSCGHCCDADDYEDGDWFSDYEDDDDDYYYDFSRGPNSSGAGPRPFFSSGSRHGGFTFGGSRFRSYEDMEKYFQEQERRDAERAKVLAEERRQRGEAEARKRKEREDARRAEEEAIQKEKVARKDAERLKQEDRWKEAGAITKDEKLATCLHSDNCPKVPQKKKFKCGTCGKKGGMTAFECPFCSVFLCQQCVTRFSDRRAKGMDLEKPRPKSQFESESDEEEPEGEEPVPVAEPVLEPETGSVADVEPAPSSDTYYQAPKEHSKSHNISQRDIEDKCGSVNGLTSKKAKKKNEKEYYSPQSEKSSIQPTEPPISIPGMKINGIFSQKNTKKGSDIFQVRLQPVQAPTPIRQPFVNSTHSQTIKSAQVDFLAHKGKQQVNGFNNKNINNRPVPSNHAPKRNGIPGLQPFPPPPPEPLEPEEALEDEAHVSNHSIPPSIPAGLSRFRKPVPSGPKPQAGFSCYICGVSGHLARNCSQPRSCYNCGGTGHLAKFCTKNSAACDRQSAGLAIPPDPRTLIPDFQNIYPEDSISATKVAIKGATLARGITEPLLRQAMESFGAIVECIVDRKAGIAWTVFLEHEALQNAIAASPVPVAKGAVRISEWGR